MTGQLLGGVLIGLIFGAAGGAFLVIKFVNHYTKNRWMKLLEESTEHHEGLWRAYSHCEEMILEASDLEDIKQWVRDEIIIAKGKAENILKYKDERAHALALEDTIAELGKKKEQ